MSRPLPPGDPDQLGPFRLSARLSESAAGIVFLGVDAAGRRASVAVLNRGAAEDAAARDRFRAAINAAAPGAAAGGPGGGGPGSPAGEPSPVVAAQPEGAAPWVATLYEADRPGAERFLEPVMFQGPERSWWGGRRRGPQFQPYWLGSQEQPALERPEPPPGVVPAPVGERPPERNLVAVVLALLGALLVLVLLMGVLFACQPEVTEPPPEPAEPTPTFEQPSRSPPPTGPPGSGPGPPSPPGGTPGPTPTDDGGPL